MLITLVVGLTNRTDAVLLSDSLCRWSKDGVGYKDNDPYRKLMVLGNPHFVVGIAGSTSAIRIMEEINKRQGVESKWECAEFRPLVEDIRERIEEEYSDRTIAYSGSLNFLFAGFHNSKPRLFLVTAQTTDQDERKVSGVNFCDSKKAVGVEPHGALYLSYQFHTMDLSTESLIALGAFAIRASSKHDPNAGGPINYVVVRDGQRARIESMLDRDIEALDLRIKDFGSMILKPLPTFSA